MARLTVEQWAEARLMWESDIAVTFEDVAEQFGCTPAAVGQKAKKEGWERHPDLRSVTERAQIKADAKTLAQTLDETLAGKYKKAAREAAEDIRADIIHRHRADWAGHRKLFGMEEIKADFNEGKSAKISAEMILIRQRGERAAYGMDEGDTSQAIVIERSYGAKR